MLKLVRVFGSQTEGRFDLDVTGFVNSKRLSYPHNCLTLDLTGVLNPEQFQHFDMIIFDFKSEKGSSVEITIEDRLSALERDNPDAKRGFMGSVIEHNLERKAFTKYVNFRSTLNFHGSPPLG